MPVDHVAIDRFAKEWSTIASLLESVESDQWLIDTECEGWTVKDQVSHLIGIERLFAGAAPEKVEVPDYSYLRNDLARLNEIPVELRRPRPPADVVREFVEVYARRTEQLRAYSDAEWDESRWTPAGNGDMTALLGTRLWDLYAHEQDIRLAIGQPGHLEGEVVEDILDRAVGSFGFVLVKRVGAPDGTCINVHIQGQAGRDVGVTVNGARGQVGGISDSPTASITLDCQTLTRLSFGRWQAEATIDSGRASLQGDRDLATQFLGALNVTP